MRSGPESGAVARRAVSARSVAAASRSRARATTSSPTSVSRTLRLSAFHQLRAEQALELLDAGRQRGLGDELGFRGGAEIEALGELDQVAELAQGGEGGHDALRVKAEGVIRGFE